MSSLILSWDAHGFSCLTHQCSWLFVVIEKWFFFLSEAISYHSRPGCLLRTSTPIFTTDWQHPETQEGLAFQNQRLRATSSTHSAFSKRGEWMNLFWLRAHGRAGGVPFRGKHACQNIRLPWLSRDSPLGEEEVKLQVPLFVASESAGLLCVSLDTGNSAAVFAPLHKEP